MSRFEIFKSLKVGEHRPFRLVETIDTFDGPRSRIMEGSWESWREAAEHVRKVDPFVHATHHIQLLLKEGCTVLYQEQFYGTDLEAEQRLGEMWNDKTPANGSGYLATLRRQDENEPYQEIG